MDEYVVLRCQYRSEHPTIPATPTTRGLDDRREVARGPRNGAESPGLGGRTMAAPPPPVLPDPEVTRLQRVLEDVQFSLERGYWQAALAAVRATLAHDEATKRCW